MKTKILLLLLLGWVEVAQGQEVDTIKMEELKGRRVLYEYLEKDLLQKIEQYKDILSNANTISIADKLDNIKQLSAEINCLYDSLLILYNQNEASIKEMSSKDKAKYVLKKYTKPKRDESGNISSVRDELDKKTDNELMSEDVYNPINFTTLTERIPKYNGSNKKYTYSLWSGSDYIKKGSQLHLSFDKTYIEDLGANNLDLQVLAYIQRKDKTVKPLTVFGFTDVQTFTQNTDNLKNATLQTEENETPSIDYTYKIKVKSSLEKSYSGELNLAWEEISEDDKIILHINNKSKSNTGFSMVLVYDDFGWKQNPTGGFSFVKIAKSGFTEFLPAASIGYSFRYQPRRSIGFFRHFISPSFGPMLHVFQNNEDTTIGAGVYLSTFYNMVSVGFGSTINGVNHGKPYFSIGLNFIESYNTLTTLSNK